VTENNTITVLMQQQRRLAAISPFSGTGSGTALMMGLGTLVEHVGKQLSTPITRATQNNNLNAREIAKPSEILIDLMEKLGFDLRITVLYSHSTEQEKK